MAKILICVPCRDRRRIVEECLPTIANSITTDDALEVYNDGSSEYTTGFLLERGAKCVHLFEPAIGIERQRRIHFMEFDPKKFTHLYLTDSDAIHDPNWREHALYLQEKTNYSPVCLYNTAAHVRLAGNTIQNDPEKEYILRRVAPGISYLLTAEHVAVVQKALPHLPEHWHWDWTTPNLLGHMMVIARQSHVDHIGYGGMHHPAPEGLDGGDRAINPTSWLVSKRAEVVKKLSEIEYPFPA